MIAQGDFLKLLLAPTEDRKKIFQQIFKTRPYALLQDKLKEESSSLGRQVEDLRSSLRQYIQGIQGREEDIPDPDLQRAAEGSLPFAETLEVIAGLIEKDSTQLKVLEEAGKTLEEELTRISTDLGKAGEIEKNRLKLLNYQEELENLLPRKVAAKEALNQARAQKPEIEALSEKLILLREGLKDYEELESLKQKRHARTREKEVLEKNLKTWQDELKTLKKVLDSGKEELNSLQETPLDLEKLNRQSRELGESKAALEAFDGSVKAFNQAREGLADNREAYRKSAAEASLLEGAYKLRNQAFLDAQAGILARELRPGEKCPVCGATHHPLPASLPESVPEKKVLDREKKALEAVQKEVQRLSVETGKLDGQLKNREEQLKKEAGVLLGNGELEGIHLRIQEMLDDKAASSEKILQQLRVQKEKALRLDELKQALPERENTFRDLEGKITEGRVSFAALETAIQGDGQRMENLLKTLKHGSKEEADKEIQSVKGKIDLFQEELGKSEEAYKALHDRTENLNGSIASLARGLEEVAALDAAALGEALTEQKGKIARHKDVHARVSSRLDRNRDLQGHILEKGETLKALEKRLVWVKALAATANGNLSGKEKIMLETYVQMTYFDRILARANTRFMVMTGGQYELKRRLEADNYRSQSGLELDVIDHYNGSERSVKTLSGGESFKAALSLALGLSDEIQSSAGGIRLDSMFVDEGFGSLDEDSLQQAMKALGDLTEGRRLVGIISHVAELKEKIDKQILVKKEKTGGSRVEIIV
ncbi:MAG: hypothetical protein AVO33_07950 [delta proteobacterium ML8_F1]|nr:MAG: hypothetical protein AVO33_07950 [delta proteobacterium ML8_F1]